MPNEDELVIAVEQLIGLFERAGGNQREAAELFVRLLARVVAAETLAVQLRDQQMVDRAHLTETRRALAVVTAIVAVIVLIFVFAVVVQISR